MRLKQVWRNLKSCRVSGWRLGDVEVGWKLRLGDVEVGWQLRLGRLGWLRGDVQRWSQGRHRWHGGGVWHR